MRDWVVKTPTLAVLCQTPRGAVKEGLGNSCSSGESRLGMGAGMLAHLAGPHAESGPLRRQTEVRRACIKSFLFHFLSDLIFQRLGPVHLHCGEASRARLFSLPGLCGWLEDPAKSAVLCPLPSGVAGFPPHSHPDLSPSLSVLLLCLKLLSGWSDSQFIP